MEPRVTYAEMEAELFARARSGMKLGLDRMQRALAGLGNPEWAAPAFHVAGTNGKGSVCAFLDAACRASGLKTGLYTSPHLERFAERFQIDGVPETEEALLALYGDLRDRLPWAFVGPDALTFFEMVTLMGFAAFGRARVDVMVIEVGLGGRLDATNVLSPAVACITSVGSDHKEFLGDTIGLIAREKAGILKPGVPGVIARQSPEARAAIDEVAASIGCQLFHEGDDFELTGPLDAATFTTATERISDLGISLRGEHQRSNAAVALQALSLARSRGIPVTATREGLSTARWPGRLETVRVTPEVVLDGAHNPPAAEALADAIRTLYRGRHVHLVLGMLADKEARPIVDVLVPLATQVTITAPASPRALPANELAELVSRDLRVHVEASAIAAVDRAIALAAPEDVVLVCGSLYLVGQVRAHLRGTTASGPGEILR